MIFVSVGTQLPFPRLIKMMGEWAEKNRNQEVICQTADDTSTELMTTRDFISAKEFKSYFTNASIIVSHAGMGNILTALEVGKPIIILPRKVSLHEHRNDHQVSTAHKFSQHPNVFVIEDDKGLDESMANLLDLDSLDSLRGSSNESKALNDFLVEAVNEWF